jgi:hypothetical protein
MRKKPFKLTEQRKHELKAATVDYLKGISPRPINGLEQALMAPGALSPRPMRKGSLLLQPHMMANEAFFLLGFAKLYSIDPDKGEELIFFIWEPGTIVVMFKEFKEKLPMGDYYIELMTDAELVSITNFCMEGIYEQHSVAYELTEKILTMKTERSMKQVELLLMTDKKRRYCVFKDKFPGLFVDGKCRLSNAEICGFLGITESTLKEARKLCPD